MESRTALVIFFVTCVVLPGAGCNGDSTCPKCGSGGDAKIDKLVDGAKGAFRIQNWQTASGCLADAMDLVHGHGCKNEKRVWQAFGELDGMIENVIREYQPNQSRRRASASNWAPGVQVGEDRIREALAGVFQWPPAKGKWLDMPTCEWVASSDYPAAAWNSPVTLVFPGRASSHPGALHVVFAWRIGKDNTVPQRTGDYHLFVRSRRDTTHHWSVGFHDSNYSTANQQDNSAEVHAVRLPSAFYDDVGEAVWCWPYKP